MEFSINDLAMEFQSPNVYEAIENIKELINLIKELRKRNLLTTIYSNKNFIGTKLAPDYYFEQMLNDERLTREERLFLKTFIVNSSKIDFNEKQFFEIDNQCSNILAYSYLNNIFVLSVRTSSHYINQFIQGILHNGNEAYKVWIVNISVIDDIEMHKDKLGVRIYEYNPKHKVNFGWGSPMDLDEVIAQKVLDSAIPSPNNKNHLINCYENKFYSFRRHHDNCFHGYIDKSMPENLKRLLLHRSCP